MRLTDLTRTRVDNLPIPDDVRPGPGWTEQMVEMAAHIGAFAVLQLVDRFGGLEVYIPVDPAKGVLPDVIGAEKAAIISGVYARERFVVPVAAHALRYARRQGIVAAVRRRDMTMTEGAAILKTSRNYLRELVNKSDEGTAPSTPRLELRRSPSQIELFNTDEED